MRQVQTVLGPIVPEELGFTLMHEHLICGHPSSLEPLRANELEDVVELCVDSLEEARSYGLETLVDATPIDLGRDVELLRRVSSKTGVNIIAATGFYMETPDSPYREKLTSPEGFYEILMREISIGIEGTGIKAGVIKVGTGNGSISEYESNILKAAARAQKETGVPIITHTESGTMGPEQADLLLSEGAEPSRVAIG
ncbi:MAG: phosphotriesterase, partial [Dehalococcoidia bacterium]|nr:phosphotriesterase [Dehalococcoidia bacterium]